MLRRDAAGQGAGARLTALFTSAPIFAASAAVNSFSAKEVGQMSPSSSFASCLKPNVADLELNVWALWKKQTTLPPWHTRASRTRFRREGWRAGVDDRMELLGHGAIRSLHLCDLGEHVAFPVRLVRAAGRGALPPATLWRAASFVEFSGETWCWIRLDGQTRCPACAADTWIAVRACAL
jgi:hypothetical protein